MNGRQLFIGIDVGGTNLRVALVSAAGEILCQERYPTEIGRGLDPFLDRLVAGIRTMQGEASLRDAAIGGVGVGVPGLISPDGFVHSSVNLLPLEGVNLREILVGRTGFEVRVLNDANAFALGEARFGAGREFASFLVITLGTGVGGGLVLERQLWTGRDGSAGEYGHATVYPDGRVCSCGNSGCLEQYASAPAIAASARRRIAAGEGTVLALLPPEGVTACSVADAARHGDPVSLAVFREAGTALGIAAASLANLLNLEALLVSGGVAESFDLLEPSLLGELRRRAFTLPSARLAVIRGELGEDAGILGSAAAAMNGIFLERRKK